MQEKNEKQCHTTTCESQLNEAFWDKQYINNETGWDLQQVASPIKNYIDQLENKTISILIPGCGNAYEAVYLYEMGFQNITLVDISITLINTLKEKLKHTKITVLHQDFFEHQGKYDLILEQTFFCAINPSLRKKYVEKMHELLHTNGKLVGLLFEKQFEKEGPPFGGSKWEYEPIFAPYFLFNKFELCYNSILPRKEAELFINLLKKT